MDFPVKFAAPVSQKTACAILPVFEHAPLPNVSKQFDRASKGRLARALKSGEISGELGKVTTLPGTPGTAAETLLLAGCGPATKFSGQELSRALSAAVNLLKGRPVRDAISYLTFDQPAGIDSYYCARATVEAARAATYSFDELKTKPGEKHKLRRLGVAVSERSQSPDARRGIAEGRAIANGTDIARNLGNRPANVCTPSHIAETAQAIGEKSPKLKVRILSEKDMRRLGMGSLLSVARGATEPARLIVMEYQGAERNAAPIALCGKGVTFDTGGISLKPPPKMDEMKFDMCGAGAVVGAMAAIAEIQPQLNVVAVIPATENMPGSEATRPGDIVTSMSGQTIEILNTDAEGRLILCDAITYAQTFNPSCVIDVATLTGACVIALGHIYTGVFSNNEQLASNLLAAGTRALDLAWPMPVDPEYGESLRSNFADFSNSGSREGGASIAANFLSKFVDNNTPWAHLDIAGVAWKSDKNKGATGRPVPLLVDYLLNC